jgi:hydroxymethylpyrimidine pyrophosphatase-like HAD family hydrolase
VLLRECDPGSGLVYNRTIRTKVRLDSPICFIEFNGTIVYDFHNPEIYNDYLKKNTSCQIAAEKPASSNAIQVEPSFSYSLASLLDEQLPTL